MDVTRPNFERPPLTEQAISVLIDEIQGFTLGDFGLFWATIKDEFPICETQPLLAPRIEAFDEPQAGGFQVQLVPMETLPRAFYRSLSRDALVQVQSDRFSFNWMKADGCEYPRSEKIVAQFFDLFERFRAFISLRELGDIAIRQCEITNVNLVPVSDAGTSFGAAGELFQVPNATTSVEFLRVESYMQNIQYTIQGDDGGPLGRLYAVLNPVFKADTREPFFRYELTARGAPLGPGDRGIRTFFERARSAINAAFMAGTTARAKKLWGVEDVRSTQD